MNSKISIVVILAITAFLATAATASVFYPTQADAAKPSYCKPGTGCFSSQTQCEKKSPGGSGGPHCD